MLQRHVPSCKLTSRIVHSFGSTQHAVRHYIIEAKCEHRRRIGLGQILQLKLLKIAVSFLVFPCTRA